MGIHTDTYSIVYRAHCNGECWLVCSPLHHPGDVAKKSKNLDPEINRWKTWIWAMAENVHYSGWNKHFRLRTFSIFRGPDFQANQINTSQLSCPSCGWETLSFSAPQVAFLGMAIARQPLGHVLPLHGPSDLSPAQPAAGAQASQGPWSFDSLSSAESNEEKGCEFITNYKHSTAIIS